MLEDKLAMLHSLAVCRSINLPVHLGLVKDTNNGFLLSKNLQLSYNKQFYTRFMYAFTCECRAKFHSVAFRDSYVMVKKNKKYIE
jgi:hypothetical protein